MYLICLLGGIYDADNDLEVAVIMLYLFFLVSMCKHTGSSDSELAWLASSLTLCMSVHVRLIELLLAFSIGVSLSR